MISTSLSLDQEIEETWKAKKWKRKEKKIFNTM